MRNKKILLINRGNSDNLGDQAISFTLKNLLETISCDVTVVDLVLQLKTRIDYQSGIKEKSKAFFKGKCFDFVRRLKWVVKHRNQIRSIFDNEYDVVMIGGGQLINSNTYFPIAVYLWSLTTKVHSKAKLVFFAIGVDSSFSISEKLLFVKSLRLANEIFVRDEKSLKNLETRFGIQSTIVPDVVFSIRKFLVDDKKLPFQNSVLINPTEFSRYEKHKSDDTSISQNDYWCDLIDEYYMKGYNVKLFYTTKRDYLQCLKIKDSFENDREEIVDIAVIQSISDLATLISCSSIIISQRMHALIFGYVFEITLKPIIISEKLKSFNEEYVLKSKNIDELINQIYTGLSRAVEIE